MGTFHIPTPGLLTAGTSIGGKKKKKTEGDLPALPLLELSINLSRFYNLALGERAQSHTEHITKTVGSLRESKRMNETRFGCLLI